MLGPYCVAQEVARPHWRDSCVGWWAAGTLGSIVSDSTATFEQNEDREVAEAAGCCWYESHTHKASGQTPGQPVLMNDQGSNGHPSPDQWFVFHQPSRMGCKAENCYRKWGKCYFLCVSDIFSTEALCRERVLNVSSEGLGFNPSLSHPKFLANLSNFLVSCISVSLSLKWGLKIIEVRTKRIF